MHMVRHNNNRMNMSLDSVVVQAVPQHDVPDWFSAHGVVWEPWERETVIAA